jgi:hypothetical protein
VSDKALELASWIVLCCNIPHEMLNLDEAFVLMCIAGIEVGHFGGEIM